MTSGAVAVGGGGSLVGGGAAGTPFRGRGFDDGQPLLGLQHHAHQDEFWNRDGAAAGGMRVDHGAAHRLADHTPARDRSNDTTLNYATWVVVFGLAESKNAAQMHFSGCGEIVDSVESAGNWIFLEFREPASAERALKMNGKLISSGTIIGVEKLTASRAVELNLQISHRVHGNANRHEYPISRDGDAPATPSRRYLKPAKRRDSICARLLKLFGLGGGQ